jgi:hypothetical protein
MPSRRDLLTASAATLVFGAGLQAAATTTPPGPPAEAAPELPGAVWTGAARMRFFGLAIYDASLWVAPGFSASRYAQSPLALQLTYLRSLNGRSIAQRSLEEMRRGATLSPAQEQRWLAAMQEAFPDVHSGDRITGLHQPGVGARFWFNGQPRTMVRDPDFSRLFFGIWLAEFSSEPDLRVALLAGAAP